MKKVFNRSCNSNSTQFQCMQKHVHVLAILMAKKSLTQNMKRKSKVNVLI